jgi:phosphate-selective porin OprO/OprP
MSVIDRSSPGNAAEAAILRAVRETRFGAVEVTVHEGRVVQIERKEKMRFTTNHAPDRTAGLFNGVPDGSSADVDTNDGKDTIGRVFVRPFPGGPLAGLGVGVAASAGTQKGNLAAPGLAAYRSASQQTFYSWRAGTTTATTALADGRRERWSPQLSFHLGRFGLLSEYVLSRQEVMLGAASDTIDAAAWQVSASFVLTGEDASYRSVVPRRPLGQGPGAWEVVARAGALSVDDAAFPVFADPAVSARRAQEVGIGLNGILTRNVRVMADVVRTTFTGGDADGDRDDELAALTRFQVSF